LLGIKSNEKQKFMATNQIVKCDKGLISKIAMVFGIILIIAVTVYVGFLSRNKLKEFDYIGRLIDEKNDITISGQGKVVAVPDIAKIQIGLTTQKMAVADAQKENSEKMNKIIKAIKDLGIESNDLKTVSYYIQPQYDWVESGRVFKGYLVSQSVEVKIRETDKISGVLGAAGELGANNIGDLSFEVDNVEKIQQEARIQAISDAKQKAEELATAMGVKLGKITSFSENGYVPQPLYYDYAAKEAYGVGGVAEAPAVSVGESEITADVSITFELL
jgi:hypothetical protein